jgi:hypothetical protein
MHLNPESLSFALLISDLGSIARAARARRRGELYAGTGSGSAFVAANGLNVNAIRNAPSPMIHDPI